MSKITLGLLAIGLLVLSSPSKYNAMAADSSAEYKMPDKKSDKEESKLSPQIKEALTKMKTMGVTRNNIQNYKPEELSTPMVKINDSGDFQTYINVEEVNKGNLAHLESLGVIIEIAKPKYKIVQGWVPFDKLDELSNLSFVTKVTPPSYGKTRTGSVETEGDAILGSDDVRDILGFDGSGIRVCAISDGADSVSVSQATGDLPDDIEINPVLPGNGDEGTALMEIIHDIAPGALLFFSGPNTSVEMIGSIEFCANNADVIIDDLGFLGEPFFEDGPVAEAAADAVDQGVVFVSAGGNDADQHYQALYRDTEPSNGDNNLHDFGFAAGHSSDVAMRVLIPPQQTVIFVLQWNDRFGQSSNDYDLFIFDPSDGEEITRSDDVQNGNDDPIELAGVQNPSPNNLPVDIVINRFSGQARTLEMFFNGPVIPQEFNVPEDSIFGHPAVSDVIAVGAVHSNNPNNIEPFSSQGPVTISFPSESRPKPDLVAPDRVSITGAGDFPSSAPGTFAGTSAAAPHVAGVVALLLDKNPNLTPAQTANILGDTAIDLGQGGFDDIFGFGRVDAFDAVQSVTQGNNSENGNGDGGNSGCSLARTSFNSSAWTISNLLMLIIPLSVIGLRRIHRRKKHTNSL
ncbi:MAG: S8 family serine peptidase [Deltaproteobacteria bacterium]|nr:S8 family serine peptidase [Deltaproteobacteria bacterium]